MADGLPDVPHDPAGDGPPARPVQPWFSQEIDVNALAAQQVRVVQTGCGASGDRSASNTSSYSVASVGSFGRREPFTCPSCQKVFTESIGDMCPRAKGGCGITRQEHARKAKGPVC